MRCRTLRQEHDPYEFADLATYNSEKARGIVHTPEWEERMKAEQVRWEALEAAEAAAAKAAGLTEVSPGVWVRYG